MLHSIILTLWVRKLCQNILPFVIYLQLRAIILLRNILPNNFLNLHKNIILSLFPSSPIQTIIPSIMIHQTIILSFEGSFDFLNFFSYVNLITLLGTLGKTTIIYFIEGSWSHWA